MELRPELRESEQTVSAPPTRAGEGTGIRRPTVNSRDAAVGGLVVVVFALEGVSPLTEFAGGR